MASPSSEAPRSKAGPRFARSFAANIGGYAVSLVSGLFFTPFLVRTLGPAGFGLIPLATSLATYLSLLTLALNATVGRFVLIALERGDMERARRLFSTALATALLLAAALLGPLSWSAWRVDRLLNVPPGLVSQARWLFLFAGLSFLATETRAIFEVALFCRQRMDLRSALSVSELVIRIGLIVALFAGIAPRLAFVGLGMLAGAAVALGGAVYCWRSLTPELTFRARSLSREALRELAASGTWISFGQLGTLLFLAIDLLVVNRLFGAEQTGRYAAVLQWSSVLRGLAGAISVVFAPAITQLYAQGSTPDLVAFTKRALRLGGAALAVPVGLVCGMSEDLLRVWIGPEMAPLSGLLWLLTFHLSINLAFSPLVNIPIAMNKVRTMGLVQTALGVCNLGLAVLLAGPLGLGIRGVAIAGMIVLTAKNVLFTSMYSARLLRLPATVFLRDLAVPLIVATATALAAHALAAITAPASLLALAVTGAIATGAVVLPGAWLVLDPVERRGVVNAVRKLWT